MRSVRNNTTNGNRIGDPGGNNYNVENSRVNNFAANSSSEDEDELTQLKPSQHSQKLKQTNKNSKKVGSNKNKNYTNGIFQEPGTDLSSHHFIMNNGQYEDTLSPNESENAYAEASLLPTSMANQLNHHNNRYEQGKQNSISNFLTSIKAFLKD